MYIFLWLIFSLQEKISALKKQANPHIVQQAQREQDHLWKKK